MLFQHFHAASSSASVHDRQSGNQEFSVRRMLTVEGGRGQLGDVAEIAAVITRHAMADMRTRDSAATTHGTQRPFAPK
ncbi:hypothetical protein E5345_02010 [Propionibacterium sp. NM47_B9-13]|nr:hypothetical protein BCB70_08370 [Cutibacterium modestum]EFS74129.1 hypothetical protein HMPREF9621_01668 [Cutibacterium modestum HL037PA2]EFT15340.1 hypothetical protein HMPREF9622_01546 [Cutibacterium modestum HL037PA3]REB73664.1 hypothetical protein CP877_08880 [Cutibacterium modestum]TGY30067.1 hypothetical protein E5345_02010 [Propionibacterium sp. NM47_B9-13]